MHARHKEKPRKLMTPSLRERNYLLPNGSRSAQICLDTQLGYAAIESQIYSSSISSSDSCAPMERPAKRVRLAPQVPTTQDSPIVHVSSSTNTREAVLSSRVHATQPARVLKTHSPAAPSSLLPDTYNLSKSSQGGSNHTSPEDAVPATINVSNGKLITQPHGSLAARGTASESPHGHTSAVLGSQGITAQHGALYAIGRSDIGISEPQHSSTVEDPKVPSSEISQRQKLATRPPERSSPKSSIAPPNSAVVSQPTSPQLQQLSLHPKEIWARPPTTDSLDWSSATSHLTSELCALEQKLGKRYRPALETRPLDPWERGYWLLDTDTWPVGIQIHFWEFLSTHVRRGVAGFATWSEMEIKMSSDGKLAGLGKVKIWCWGDQVMHIYLLILVASKLGVWKSGAEWRDWKGELVVQVRPRPVKHLASGD